MGFYSKLSLETKSALDPLRSIIFFGLSFYLLPSCSEYPLLSPGLFFGLGLLLSLGLLVSQSLFESGYPVESGFPFESGSSVKLGSCQIGTVFSAYFLMFALFEPSTQSHLDFGADIFSIFTLVLPFT